MHHPGGSGERLLLRVEEVAKLLGVGRTTVYALVSEQQLPVVRIGRSLRIPREALDQWVREQIDGDADDEDASKSPDYAIPRVRYAFKPAGPQSRP